MKILRNALGVIVGYLVFALSAVSLFQSLKVDPHADPTGGFALFVIVYGIVFGFVAGYITQLISKSGKRMVNYVLAVLMAGFATFSLLKTNGNHYSQLSTILLFAPVSILGGLFFLKGKRI